MKKAVKASCRPTHSAVDDGTSRRIMLPVLRLPKPVSRQVRTAMAIPTSPAKVRAEAQQQQEFQRQMIGQRAEARAGRQQMVGDAKLLASTARPTA